MSIGIFPVVSASKRGGFRLVKDKPHVFGLFQVALMSGDSANPFQELGLGEWMIFEPLTMATFAPVKDRITDIFEDFERQELGALQERPDNLTIIETRQGEAAILVYAVDLESDSKFAMTVSGSSSGLFATIT